MQDKFKLYQPWLTLLARLGLGGVLLSVRAYEMLPVGLANFLGFVLPWIEIGMGLLLIVGVAVSIVGLLGALTMLAFVVAIAQAWARGLSIDCGCFGGGGEIAPEETKYLSTILRDIGFLLLGVYLYYFPKGKFGLDK
jgi:uncharacterized membrane protein YphA (DoxX/SURF4 family)